MTTDSPNRTRWSREQIRADRLAPLLPLLQQRGLQIIACEADNFILPAYPGLIVKDSYWRWPERNLVGKPPAACHFYYLTEESSSAGYCTTLG